MEKPFNEGEVSEMQDSSDADVAEEMEEDEPQKQEDPESEIQDNQTAGNLKEETRNEKPVGLTDNNFKRRRPNSEQCEESMQNVPEELTRSTGMEHEPLAVECQQQGTIQATVPLADDVASEVSEQPNKIEYRMSIGKIIEKILNSGDSVSLLGTKKSAAIKGNERDEERQHSAEAEIDLELGRDLEQCQLPEQEMQVHQVEQVMELVPMEAVICDPIQEQKEEAKDIEEPQKYAFREKEE